MNNYLLWRKALVLTSLLSFLFLFSVFALPNDASSAINFKYTYPTNYSLVNTNNSLFLLGKTWETNDYKRWWFNQTATALNYNQTTTSFYNSSYVPYTGATNDLILGAHNINVDSGVLFCNATSNRCGIGTINPSSILNLNGTDPTITLYDITNNQASTILYEDGGAYERFILSPLAGGSPSFNIQTQNLVGGPGKDLLFMGMGSATSDYVIEGYEMQDMYIQTRVPRGNGSIIFRTNETEDMRILQNGYIGIGISLPTHPLEIVGNATDGVSLWVDGNVSASGYIDRTTIWDSKLGSALDYIKTSTEVVNADGSINHTLKCPTSLVKMRVINY